MWFDARAALVRIESGAYPIPQALERAASQDSRNSQPPAVQSDNRTAQPDPAQFARFAGLATSRRGEPKPLPCASPETRGFPYGTACDLGENPRTWTGRIVAMADWKRLTDWERDGPNGRHWCGKCQAWHEVNECEGA
jgi:hypothetical protein